MAFATSADRLRAVVADSFVVDVVVAGAAACVAAGDAALAAGTHLAGAVDVAGTSLAGELVRGRSSVREIALEERVRVVHVHIGAAGLGTGLRRMQLRPPFAL